LKDSLRYALEVDSAFIAPVRRLKDDFAGNAMAFGLEPAFPGRFNRRHRFGDSAWLSD
jgi:hypothetical protein